MLADEGLFSGRAALVVGFALVVMILVVLNALRQGTVKLKYGIVANRSDSPREFWLGIAVLVVGALMIAIVFIFVLSGWLGQ
ncbi:MAG: hypothetical protein ACTHN5_13100 [Phycisphaerae bacterium]